LNLLQTSLVGVRATDVAAFLDPVEERPWRSPDSVSACVAGSFLMLTIETAIVNATAHQHHVDVPARLPVRPLG
jgi:hypothetical protein